MTREVHPDSEVVKYIHSSLGDRKSFAIAFDSVESIVEYTPRDKKAIREMR